MNNTSPKYYPLSNDIFDALYSSPLRFSMTQLRKYALSRGLVCSPLLSKEDLCLKIASLPCSYKDFQELSEALETTARKPKSQAKTVSGTIDTTSVQNVFNNLKEKHPNDSMVLNSHADGSVSIKIEYSEIDHKQTRLKQRIQRSSTININPSDENGTSHIVSSSNSHTRAVLSSLISEIETKEGKELLTQDIDLSSFAPSKVNQFFIELAQSIADLPFSHAVSVKLQKSTFDEDDSSDEELRLLASINNATLRGENILNSSQVREFLKEDLYYIHTLRWETEEVTFEDVIGAKLIIETSISPPTERTDFSFDIISYRNKINKTTDFVKNSKVMKLKDKKQFLNILQTSAFSLFNKLSK